MPTLLTDPRSGGVKKKSGVQVLPIVAETWAKVRNDADPTVDWLIASYEGKSKTDVTVLDSGFGGMDVCAQRLPHDKPVFGGCRLKTGRFVTFYYCDEDHTSVIVRGRAAMHKNGVLNVLEGADCEIEMRNGLIEEDVILGAISAGGGGSGAKSSNNTAPPKHIHGTSTATTYTSYSAVSSQPAKHNDTDGTGTVVTTRVMRGGNYIHPEKIVTKTTFGTPGTVETMEEVDGTTTVTKTIRRVVQAPVEPETVETVEGDDGTTTITKTIRRVVQVPAEPTVVTKKTTVSSCVPATTQNKKTTTKTIVTPSGDTATVTTTTTETHIVECYEPAIVPYAFIKGIRDPAELPPGVDPDAREMSLSDKEFMEVFGMDKFKWDGLATWKKKGMRREKDLF
mmetsp:Transcript_42135/g.63633  ORF Transcript_42135/g.63633 Transcript_42135/m.63633 type:complete len:395 (-) Transcript_42135:286-1470(-)